MATSPPPAPSQGPSAEQLAWVEEGKRLLNRNGSQDAPAPASVAASTEAGKIQAELQQVLQNRATYDPEYQRLIAPIEQANKELDAATKAGQDTKQAVENARAALKELNDENQRQKAAFETEFAKIAADRDRIANGDYGNPPGFHFESAVQRFSDTDGTVRLLVAKSHWKSANRVLKMLPPAIQLVAKGRAEFATYAQNMLTGYRGMLNGVPAEKSSAADRMRPFRDALVDADAAVKRVNDQERYGDAYKALDKCAKAALGIALRPEVGSAGRKHIAALLEHDPNFLNTASKDEIDALVDSVGSKAGSGADRKIVQAAITARFGPELTGDLGGRYLCRLYTCLGKVPIAHTKGNKKLAKINRTRKLFHDGDYDAGVINLNVRTKGLYDKSGAVVGSVVFGNEFGFDQLTLHEVGHAVDDKTGFMKSYGKTPAFGGWEEHKVGDVAKKIGEGKGFFATPVAGLSRDFLEDYLVKVLEGKDPSKECRGGPPPKDSRWKDLANHPATAVCKTIKCKGDDGLWDKSDPSAYAVSGRVYQESYEGNWTSYDLSARSTKLSNYQFRASGEWYAEAYAAFYRNKLPKSHPLYTELRKAGPPERG